MYRCEVEEWKDYKDDTLTPEIVTFYDIKEKIIISRTVEKQCSYVELVANGPQQSNWFVSFPWLTPLIDLIYCLKQHCRDHELSEEATFYWIDVSSYSISFYPIIKYINELSLSPCVIVDIIKHL